MGDLCPLARRRAKELGRIVRSDIESVATAKVTAAAGTITGTTAAPIGNGATPASTGAWHAAGRGERSRSACAGHGRRAVASVAARNDRMVESARTVPSFLLIAEVDMTRALELRARIAELGQDTVVPTVTDLVLASCVRTGTIRFS